MVAELLGMTQQDSANLDMQLQRLGFARSPVPLYSDVTKLTAAASS